MSKLRRDKKEEGQHLVLAVDKEQSKLSSESKNINQDTHLVFEYGAGDEILGYRAPRSNRFYFVSDPIGGALL